MRNILNYIIPLAFMGLFVACGGGDGGGDNSAVVSKKAGLNEITIHQLGDPDKLQPITSTSANSTYIQGNIFQTLLGADPVTYEQYGLIAKSRPVVKEINDGEYKGGMSLEYEIRPEAVWDNGTPITANDYVFTVKSMKNPKTDAAHIRPYFEFIKDIVIDPSNDKKFTIYAKDRYILSEEFSGYWVLPEYIYDPEKIMRKFTIKELNEDVEKLRGNKFINEFAKLYNSEPFAREKGYVVGSGPYDFVEWKTKRYITLTKKKDWWGNKIKEKGFDNGPDKIVYKVVPDWTTAITAMKDEEMDIASGIRAKDFVDLKENESFKKLYDLHAPDFMTYDYIGMNMRKPIFSDKKVRQAMAHLVDRKLIREVLMYGYGEAVDGPYHPTKAWYNKNLKSREIDLNKAKELLAEAGWKDTDNDGLLDKVIDGKKTPFKVSVKYNQGNTRRENSALMFKENAKKVGIEADVQVREWTVFIEETKAHNFDMYVGGWVGGTGLNDSKQIWHSSSYNGGSNYVGFGTPESDELIEKIRYNLDESSRTQQYLRLQEIIHDEAPYVFLNAQKNKLAFHKRFNSANAYVPRPGYSEVEWSINPGFGAAAAE